MTKKKKITRILQIIIAIFVSLAVVSIVVLPQWKGIFVAGCLGFLILNLLISMFFINRNIKD